VSNKRQSGDASYNFANARTSLSCPDIRSSLLERAFQLAGHGASLEAIRRQLNSENYADVDLQLSSSLLKRQLRAAGSRPAFRGTEKMAPKSYPARTPRQPPSMRFKKCEACQGLFILEAPCFCGGAQT